MSDKYFDAFSLYTATAGTPAQPYPYPEFSFPVAEDFTNQQADGSVSGETNISVSVVTMQLGEEFKKNDFFKDLEEERRSSMRIVHQCARPYLVS